MNWRLAALSLIFQFPVLHAQNKTALRLDGDEALAAGLWEIAAMRYDDLLADPDLPREEKSAAALRLAESWIRGGQAGQALMLLEDPFVAGLPESRFWKAHALAGINRFGDSIEELGSLLADPDAPYRAEAAHTRANLQLALDDDDGALATLSSFAATARPAQAASTRLRIVALLLDREKVAEARTTMTAVGEVPARRSQRAVLLEARLLLAEAHPAAAADAFESLVADPHGQSLMDYHAAALGLADARAAAGNREDAVAGLLAFIGAHPDSPLLEPMFARIGQWLPEAPAGIDPILEQLGSWIPPHVLPETDAEVMIPVIAPGVLAAWPVRTAIDNLASFAMFTRAQGLYRIGTVESREEARRLMNRLRLENPDHPLIPRVMLELGRWQIADGKIDRAFAILDRLAGGNAAPDVQSRAAFFKARAAYESGDAEAAALGFEEAAEGLESAAADVARLNAALSRLRDGPDRDALTLIENPGIGNPALAADFELERALSTSSSIEKRTAIEHFISRHADHPRVPEARLAAAETALEGPKPDLPLARNQIAMLQALPDAINSLPADRLALVRLRIADLEGDPVATIEVAKEALGSFPEEPVAREAAFTLGRNHFLTGDYNDARLVLQKLAANEDDSARSQAAWLLAARAASLGATTQSREEALALFDKAIDSEGPLRSIAILEKGSFMIKPLNRFATAAAFLREHFRGLPENDPLRLPLGLLLGEAIYAKGSSDPESLQEALDIYNGLLDLTDEQPALRHRLQYLRGRVLELLPRKDDPSLKRDAEALDAYISVIEAAALAPPAEWEYFELCGFRALERLKAAERWKAAIAVAEKIASFDSPNARDAAEAAQYLRLKHMIWDD